MTMDDEQVDYPVYTFKQREALAAALPWVAREDTASEQCQAIKGSAPLKAHWNPRTHERVPEDDPVRMKHRCRFSAKWVFVSKYGRVRLLCWHHLIAHGIRGTMEEEARARAWDEAHLEVIDAILKSEA